MKRIYCLPGILLVCSLAVSGCSSGSQPAAEEKPEESAAASVQPEETAAALTELSGGASREEAESIPLNLRCTGTYTEGEQWFSFQTSGKEEVPYTVTLEILKSDGSRLFAYLYDESGVQIEPEERNYEREYHKYPTVSEAAEDGRAATGTVKTLKPDTVYYVMINGWDRADYSLRITDPDSGAIPVSPKTEVTDGSDLFVSASQDEAPLISTNVRYQAAYEEGSHWYAFRTGKAPEVPYKVTLEVLKTDSSRLFAYMFDEYGTLIEPDERNYEREYHKYPTLSEAIEDGRAATGTIKTLKPDTVYYVMINGGDKADYSLRITDPEVGRIPVSPKESSPESSALLISANQDEAPLISSNVRYQTTYEEGYHWFAFKTGEEPVPYTVTLENLKPGSSRLYAYLFDAYGTLIEPDERNYEREYHKYPDVSEATDDGRAATGTIKTLETETVYYVRVSGGDASEYTLMVADSAEEVPETGTAAGERDVTEGGLIVPGTSQSSALNIPIGTKVHGKYAGGYSWLAFTTAEEADIPYRITMVNETYGSGRLYLYLFDELGTQIDIDERNYEREYHKYPAVSEATEDGRAATGTVTGLKPNTTYFLRLQGSDEAGYSVLVTMPEKQDSGVGTSGNIEEAKGTLSADDAFYTGTNQNNAVMLKTNTRYHGNYTEGWAWAAFTTTAEEGAEYSITVENLTPGSSLMYAYLYDEFGTVIEADERNYEREYHRYPDVSEAGEDGTAATGFVRTLQPDTTYYISLSSGDPNEYIIMIGAPEKADAQNTIKEEPAEAVFEVPFELNETQVRFVANQAVFADEEAAREALKPVAEVILAHPDHPILLAGTTATFGDQGACEDLSRRRAEAIRDMLVNEFGVTGSQLITAGLGYENDPFVRGRDIDSAGNFVETEGAKNRRVIILDAESETAQKILN